MPDTSPEGSNLKPGAFVRKTKLDKSEPPNLLGPGDEEKLAADFEAMSTEDRKAVFDGLGKDLARVAGGQALATMLRDSGLSGREIDARFGYDHTALSRAANGKSISGPTLWKLYALAEALGFDIELKVQARK